MRARLDLHPRTLHANIWRGLMCASDQEIIDGMDFYPGAHGLCRLFASIYSTSIRALTPSHVAGIYAALSPMNTWDTNVANVLDVLRYIKDPSYIETHFTSGIFHGMTEEEAIAHNPAAFDKLVEEILAGPIRLKVNTSHLNRNKALSIARGADPLSVLRGRKVRAFYACIANPNDISIAPAIDRHLINLALGTIPTKNEQSRLASNRDIYTKVEAAYQYLGRREGIGNRLASIAWFVQRRIARSGQIAFYHPSSPICCNRPLHSAGTNRFRCSICRRYRVKSPAIKRPLPEILTDQSISPSQSLSIDSRGYVRIQLGIGHALANSAGWQYLARYIVESHLGHRLRPDEHVHHRHGIKTDCRLSELEVWLAERHGRHHARTQLLYMFRDEKGRFAPSPVPTYDEQQRTEHEHEHDYDYDTDDTDLDLDIAHPSDHQTAISVPF